MNIIEAIKSGKPFRRPKSQLWMQPDEIGLVYIRETPLRMHWSAVAEDILADDWEIQEPTVTITRTQFWNAVTKTVQEKAGEQGWVGHGPVWLGHKGQWGLWDVARELGLEP